MLAALFPQLTGCVENALFEGWVSMTGHNCLLAARVILILTALN